MTKEILKTITKQIEQLSDEAIESLVSILKKELEYRKIKTCVEEVLDDILDPYV